MLSKWIYVLIGNNNTGKTTFQKRLIYHLTGYTYVRLDRNTVFEVTHEYAPKKLSKISLMSRSYQESKDEYETVENYFEKYFQAEDVCILSTHAGKVSFPEIKEIIIEGRKRKYNVGGVFWSNADTKETAEVSLFDWDERFYLENPIIEDNKMWKEQIDRLAWEFAEMLIRRAMTQ
jgi:GTPase SAR1 family protein